VAIFAAAFLVFEYVQSQTPSFGSATDIDQPQNANALINFLSNKDSKKVHLDFYCLGNGGGGCDTNSTIQQSQLEGNPVLAVDASSQTYWVHVIAGGNAEADNGGYGAGALVIKGDFTVSVRGPSGVTPLGIQNINLAGS
jgi:hypothetical protein